MTVEADDAGAAAPVTARRRPAPIRYPQYDLADSLAVAKVIFEEGGGHASREHVAAWLDYKTTNSGAFASRVAAARGFGLIETRDGGLAPTALAQKILTPVYPDQTREGLVEAFFNQPLFKAIYEEHKGRELPPEFGLKNLLRNRYGIAAKETSHIYRVLMDSAQGAGFFTARGARTHLIIPQLRARGTDREEAQAERPEIDEVDMSGSPPPPTPPPPNPQTVDQVKLEYVRKLIAMLGTDGVPQEQLMDRIERLLNKNQDASQSA